MPAYLCDLILSANAPRGIVRTPAGADLGVSCNWMHFRERDLALLWSDTAISHPQARPISAGLDDPLAAGTRTAMGVFARDRTFPLGSTLRNALVELLTAPAADKQWGKLLPNPNTRSFNIWFGPGGAGKNRIYSSPFAPTKHSVSMTDDFNRTGNLNGSTSSDAQFTWTEDNDTLVTVIATEAIAIAPNATLAFSVARASLAMDTVDHYAEGVIGTFTRISNSLGLELIVRGESPFGGGGVEGYDFAIGNEVGTPYRLIYDWGTGASLGSDATGTTSGTLRLEASGSDLTAKVNGSAILGPITDPSPYNTFKNVGACWYVSGVAGNSVGYTTFNAGDLVAGEASAALVISSLFAMGF